MYVHWRCAALAAGLLVSPADLEPADCNGNGVADEIETIPLVLETATLRVLEGAVLEVAGTDLDGDGDLDAAAFTAGALFILEGDGRGGFGESRREPLADAPAAALSLHANGDLHADLVVAGALEDVRGRGTLSIHEGAGGGSFLAPRMLAVPQGPEALSAADLDADGALDLAVACARAGGVAVLAGDGRGSFREGAFLAVEAAPSIIETRDLDGDGAEDIVAGDPAGALIIAFLRRSDGWAGSMALVERRFETLALLDLDADGDDDLAAAGGAPQGGGFLELFENGGSGALASISARSLPESPEFLTAADLDRDALPDLVTLDPGASSVTVRIGPRAHEVPFGRAYATSSAPRGAAPGDIDGDGDLDLLVAEAGGLGILRHDGHGFDAARSIAVDRGPTQVLASGPLPGGLEAPLDFDGDGRRDLAVTQGGNDGLCTVVFGVDGDPPEEATSFVAGFSPGDAAAADLDGDGLPDLAVGSTGRSGLVLLPGLSIHLGGRSRNFSNMGHLVESSGVQVHSVEAGDFDADGDMDLASAGLQVALWENAGDGTFPRRRQLDLPRVPARLLAADLDGDLDVDLAVAAGELELLENLGGWDFAGARALGVGSGIAAADLDADGRLDLAVETPGDVHVLWSTGGGAFEKTLHRISIDEISAMATGDLDGDGDRDIVVAARWEGSVELLLNRGGRRLEALPALALSRIVGSVEAADLDGDGRAEVLATMPDEGSVLAFQARAPVGAGRDRNENRVPDVCERALFVRGDADLDGRVGISDAIRILLHLADGTRPMCEASADTDGDGRVLAKDASMLLEHLFGGGAAPAAPYPRCDGIAPADPLSCEEHTPCAG